MTTASFGSILLVGCGKMGGALLAGWRDRGIAADRVVVVEPAAALAATVVDRYRVAVLDEPGRAARRLRARRRRVRGQAPGAGRRGAGLSPLRRRRRGGAVDRRRQDHRGLPEAIWARTRPSFAPCRTRPPPSRRGITVACASMRVTGDQRDACQTLLEAVGEVAWVADEALMDAVTAVSGSGPAYVFLLIETLAQAGAAAGLPADLASRLASATVAGAGELARLSDEPAATLRQNVTSPGGTTEAALNVLMGPDGLAELMERAVVAATQRSRALAG